MDILVFTPTPTHPAIQGNRRRVFDICRAIQSAGGNVTLLYYATEGVSSDEVRLMRETWGEIEIVFPRGFVPKRSMVRYPAIDDWYDNAISEAAVELCTRRRFDACVVNYAWYSKIFDALPRDVVRVIDTHDVFGERAERFLELGLDPVWFHTSAAEEKKGLDRADFVIAIQHSEAEILQRRTIAEVRSVGFLSSPDFLPLRHKEPGERLVVGYIGSGNPFNVSSMRAFLEAAQKDPRTTSHLDICVAGAICDALAGMQHSFNLKGIVNSVADFYRGIDVSINPMLGGTGLKIKSLETLSFGKPLVATTDAMAGIATDHPGHRLAGAAQVVDYLMTLSGPGLAAEAEKSREIFHSYRRVQLRAFQSLWSEILAEANLRAAA